MRSLFFLFALFFSFPLHTKPKMDPEAQKEFLAACKKNDTELILSLIDAHGKLIIHSKTETIKNTGLHLTAKYGHIEATELLLDFDANPNALNKRGQPPYYYAVKRKHKIIEELLITDKAQKLL